MPTRSPLLITEKGIETVARFMCPNRMLSLTLHFIIDTGSGISLLGYQNALQAGIDFESLGQYGKPVAGFGGAADAKHLKDPCYIYLEFEGTLHEVEMPEGILVYRPSRKGTKHWKVEESANLLGRDFMEGSRCRLSVDIARREAYFEL